jgi:glycosyltransferase involved in cell wall biosynthesis
MIPEFLIILPTLNSCVTLGRMIASLQSQTYPNWRVLFIDGPSAPVHRQWLSEACEAEPRCSWTVQDPNQPGIFGAMNQGFALSAHTDSPPTWLLFWGSDDWAASSTVLAEVASALESCAALGVAPDLLVCSGRYVDAATGSPARASVFQPAGELDTPAYRHALLLGSTPPHQATIFGPRARQRLAYYASGFCLSADLDYFLQLSLHQGLRVQCLDLELVHMGDGGISGQQTQRRLKEVRRAYRRAFGWYWWFPFLMRYLRRVASLLGRGR